MDKLQYLDKILLPIYGFQGINDYNYSISSQDITKDMMDKINNEITVINKIFNLGSFNLSRKKYIIDNQKLALNFLRKILIQTFIPFQNIHTQSKNLMRLVPPNFLLMNYINQKTMNQIIHLDNENGEQTFEKILDPLSQTNQNKLFSIKVMSQGYISNLEVIGDDYEEINIMKNGKREFIFHRDFLTIYNKLNNLKYNKIPISNMFISCNDDINIIIDQKKISDIKLFIKYEIKEKINDIQYVPQYECLYDSINSTNDIFTLNFDFQKKVLYYILQTNAHINKIELYNDYIDSNDYYDSNNIEKNKDNLSQYYIIKHSIQKKIYNKIRIFSRIFTSNDRPCGIKIYSVYNLAYDGINIIN